ncbi:MAG: ribosome silencing factor [Calditrichaeota bacterium]|nr:ribosome silencing factor [Calditrichota bacterium]RQW03772.1 MAG: ribosome silencing factor [Calditrichota bacterium]
MNSEKLARKVARLAWEKKGNEIVILDVTKLADFTDYFVIISGESEPHVKAIADYLEEKTENGDVKIWHREGYQNFNWVLLDFIDVVVHIFREESRQFYELEKLWGDARIIRIEENAPDRISSAEKN